MNDIANTITELVKVQAQIAAFVSALAASHLSLERLVAELPDLPASARSTLLDALARAEPQLQRFQESVEQLQRALRLPPP
jgi:hypothetical protein